MKYKHIIFDLDDTLCESKQNLGMEMKKALMSLKDSGIDTLVISGQNKEQIERQLDGCPVTYILAQSGNHTPFWQTKFTASQTRTIYIHVNKVRELFPKYKSRIKEKLENRGSQVAFSFIGHNADPVLKREFDPDKKIRKQVLETCPFNPSNGLIVKIAGTTCFDYTLIDGVKGKNIEKLLTHLGWNKDDCVYFGDALFPGGNDETVIGVIETVEVKNPEDLLLKLKEL